MRDRLVYVALGAGVFFFGWWQGQRHARAPAPPVAVARPADADCSPGCVDHATCVAAGTEAVRRHVDEWATSIAHCSDSLEACMNMARDTRGMFDNCELRFRAVADRLKDCMAQPTPAAKLKIRTYSDDGCKVLSVTVTYPTPGWGE